MPYARMVVAAALCRLSLSASAAEAPRSYHEPAPLTETRALAADVVVYGGTPGGVAAAIAAARCGKTAVLV